MCPESKWKSENGRAGSFAAPAQEKILRHAKKILRA
jgi:hypothetical protein